MSISDFFYVSSVICFLVAAYRVDVTFKHLTLTFGLLFAGILANCFLP